MEAYNATLTAHTRIQNNPRLQGAFMDPEVRPWRLVLVIAPGQDQKTCQNFIMSGQDQETHHRD